MSRMLSIIIVNYRSGQLIADCLQSLYRYEHFNFEVIVVDNDSGDDSRETITSLFPQVRWIQMDYNAGFSRANNAGMKLARGDAYLLLNPDTLATDDSIENCFQRLTASAYVAAGVQLLDVNKEPQISGSFFVKGGLNHLLPITYWGDFVRWAAYSVNTKNPNILEAKGIEEVDWINGAFLMVKKEAVEKAGLMDEDFFLYGEEVEWCSRLKKVGKLAIFGDLQIIHLEGATINKSQNIQEKGYYNLYDKKGLQLMVSNHLRVRKQYCVGWFLFLLLNYSFGFFVFCFVGTLHHLFNPRKLSVHGRKSVAFGKNVFALWRLVPTIIRNKPHFYKMF